MPTNFFQRIDNFWEQRKEYRAAALVALRKREGLPSPVDEHGNPLETRFDDLGNAHYYDQAGRKAERVLWAGAGRDGKPGAFAVGSRKQQPREVADAAWHSTNPGFEILEVAEDGRRLEDELHDLDRDAHGMHESEKVSHGQAGEQAPGFTIQNPSDDAELDARLQEFLKRGAS